MNKPEQDEYAEYYGKYISLVDGDVLPMLDAQPSELHTMFGALPEEKGTYKYADDKWTLKEVLSHLIDCERIFAYRMLRISRGDMTPIEGFEQDGYIESSNANNRSFRELLDEFDLQRRADMLLVRNLSDEAIKRRGTASDYTVSVRALVYMLAGHVRHHVNILKERYSV
jgi:uncharacterized damage-inducible protein DinB